MQSWADQNLWLGALLIFLLRILDVSLGTLRIGMLVRGKRSLAGLLKRARRGSEAALHHPETPQVKAGHEAGRADFTGSLRDR